MFLIQENLFFWKMRLLSHTKLCRIISRYKFKCIQFNTSRSWFLLRTRKLQYFLNVFYTKTRFCQGLLPDLLKMFSTTLDIKNTNKEQKKIFQHNKKDRITHFNISAAVKYHRDNKDN